jgi:DNA-binding transcriptional ArsR family regulator
MLGLSKSTVHHHAALLRGAGLIRIHIPEDKSSTKKSYSLREHSLARAREFLDSYLTITKEQQRVL